MAAITDIFTVLVLFLIGFTDGDHHGAPAWSYEGSDGPAFWKNNYAICGRVSQSPIDLPPIASMTYDAKLRPFSLHGFDRPGTLYNLSMINNGHTVQVNVEGSGVSVSGGGLTNNMYHVAQFHFHWGKENTSAGSEHTYNGKSYPMELHVVTYDARFADLGSAVDKSDGLAVLGFFFEIDDTLDNCNYSPLLDFMINVNLKGTNVPVSGYKLRHLMPAMFSNYFRYSGSLTTPPCYESVQWTVFWERIRVSSAQMNKFRALYSDNPGIHHLVDNFRPVQPLNGRTIRTNIQIPETQSGGQHATSSLILIVTAILTVLRHPQI